MAMRRACTRLPPRLLAAAAEASVVTEGAALAALRRATGAAACGPHASAAAGLRHFRSSSLACSSLAETLKSEAEYEAKNYTTPEVGGSGDGPGKALGDWWRPVRSGPAANGEMASLSRPLRVWAGWGRGGSAPHQPPAVAAAGWLR